MKKEEYKGGVPVENKRNIYIMYAIALLQGLVFYGPIATLYRQVNGLSISQIGVIESVSFLLCIALEIPWGVVADKIGYKKTMLFCSVLFFASKVVFWQAESFGEFLAERIMLSVVMAGVSGVDTSILYLSCKKGESQKVFSIFNTLGLVGLLAASLLFSLFVGDNYSLSAFLTVISYGLAAVLSLFLTEVKRTQSRKVNLVEFKSIFKGVFRNKRLILFLAGVALLTETHHMIVVFLNQMQYEKCGLSPTAMGYIYIAVTVAGLLGLFSHKFTAKLGKKETGIVLGVAAVVTCLLLGVTGRASVSVAAVLLLNVINSLYQPYQMQLQNQQVVSANRATELSIYAMIIDCVRAVVSAVIGALAKMTLEVAFFFGAALCAVSLLLFIVWHKFTES